MLKIIGGTSHPEFTKKICEHLKTSETKATFLTFSNDNQFITINEPVRGEDVFVIQTQTPPLDKYITELLILIRTLRDASAERITVVLPYFPYARSDKKDQPRVCITARLIADLLETAGASRVVVIEMHAPQMQGFFSIPCDHLLAAPDVINYLKDNWNLKNYVIAAGDSGAVKMLKTYADGLNLPIAIMDKRREGNDEQVRIKSVIGEVKNKKVLLLDDETSSGRTLIKDAEFLLQTAGAIEVDACFIHSAFDSTAAERLNQSPIRHFLTTDTIPQKFGLRDLEVISLTKRCAEMIQNIYENKSVKELNEIT